MILFPVTTVHLFDLQARRFVHSPGRRFVHVQPRPGVSLTAQARRFVHSPGQAFRSQPRPGVSFTAQARRFVHSPDQAFRSQPRPGVSLTAQARRFAHRHRHRPDVSSTRCGNEPHGRITSLFVACLTQDVINK